MASRCANSIWTEGRAAMDKRGFAWPVSTLMRTTGDLD
jgi:hypothetical protein